MGIQIFSLIIAIIVAYIFSKYNWSNGFDILLTFLPILLSVLYTNVEKIRLFFTKCNIRNKTASINISVKNTYKLQGINDDAFILEKKLEKELLKNNVIIGKENNKLRIEANQKIRFVKDSDLIIPVPLLIYMRIENSNELICKLTNSVPSIVYKEIPELIKSIEGVWDYIDEFIKDISNSKLKKVFYDAKIKINTNVFKNVYLAPYAPKYIKKIELTKEKSIVKLLNDSLEISTSSRNNFEKEIKKYNSVFSGFFDNIGGK